jgi:hypothetical protein
MGVNSSHPWQPSCDHFLEKTRRCGPGPSEAFGYPPQRWLLMLAHVTLLALSLTVLKNVFQADTEHARELKR